MKKNIVSYQVYYNQIEKNTQNVKEALMREAVKQCECYCTDLLIFFDHTWHELIKGEKKEVTLYFYQTGIYWKQEYLNCRSKAILIRDIEKDTLQLTIEYGKY